MTIIEHVDIGVDELEELSEAFAKFDITNSGKIRNDDVVNALAEVRMKVPGYKARRIIDELDTDKDGQISFEEFLSMYSGINEGSQKGFREAVREVGTKVKSFTGVEGSTHSLADDETDAFTDWINYSLGDDADLKAMNLIPITEHSLDLFDNCHNGLLAAKLINVAVPDTIDERALNMKKLTIYTILENQTLVINSAKAIGCNIVNIGAQDLVDGIPHLTLGLLWQIIRIGLLAKVSLKQCPHLARLLEGDETLAQLLALPAEQILLRWFNYHLAQAEYPRRVTNFSKDIKDSMCYTVLLKQIAPRELGVTDSPFAEQDEMKRAELVLQNADKMDCRRFVRPTDIVNGHPRLNLAFVANLFNMYPGLEPMEEIVIEEEFCEETREEKTFRNWINSLGVNPFVNHLYMDLCDGYVLIQLFDKVYPGYVDWQRVNQPPFKAMGATMKKIENCNYALELGKNKKLHLVGIDGKDLYDGHPNYTLAIIWQLMRCYTLEMLKRLAGGDKPISENDIVIWVNKTLSEAGKTSTIMSFK
eukprot:Ihof_evm13s91 gene=Ihof_evmTU13s91